MSGDRQPIFNILALCGIGDILSLITRIPSVQQKYPDHQIKFFLGGFGRSPQFMKEIIEAEGYEVSLIKNLTFHNQLPQMREFIKDNAVQEGDEFQDWSFCEEIFQNKSPIFMQYPMAERYDYEYRKGAFKDEIGLVHPENMVAIQPLTKSGNAEGFESDVEKGRFWSQDNWRHIIKCLVEDDFVPLFTGYGDEDWELVNYCKEKKIKHVNCTAYNIQDTFEILSRCVGNIATNSWTWEITSRLNIPTICMYFKNHFFIQNHMPDGPSSLWDNTFIETDQNVDPYDIYNTWKQMYDKEKPAVDYTVCMITKDDEDCVQKTLDNIAMYQPNEFIVVDGGSTDKTLELIRDAEIVNTDIREIPWADDFEVQKNNALNEAINKWRVWIDADETYEHIFWNQLPIYIDRAEKSSSQCVGFPRINTIEGLSQEELQNYAQRNGWQLSGFNWINYPDIQQRVFTDQCKFVGRTHERITGFNGESVICGVHIVHPKSKARQEKGFERENKQYEIEAEKVYERVMKDE